MRAVVGEEGGVQRVDVAVDIGAGQRPADELAAAVADQRLDHGEVGRRNAGRFESSGERRGNVGERIDERSVEIEDHEIEGVLTGHERSLPDGEVTPIDRILTNEKRLPL